MLIVTHEMALVDTGRQLSDIAYVLCLARRLAERMPKMDPP